MDFKKLIFGDRSQILELNRITREEELRVNGKRYNVTIDYDVTIVEHESVDIEVFAEDEEEAEQLALKKLEDECQFDDYEVQEIEVEEIPKDEEQDEQTLEMFPCTKKDSQLSS